MSASETPLNVGIVGHERAKFTREGEIEARRIIRELLVSRDGARVVSGGCHLGGVDIWAEEESAKLGRPAPIVHLPKRQTWSGGYKERNVLIAQDSDEVHCIVVANLPESYNGMRFQLCYHCGTDKHVKSGGCWTAKCAQRLGKPAVWHVIHD